MADTKNLSHPLLEEILMATFESLRNAKEFDDKKVTNLKKLYNSGKLNKSREIIKVLKSSGGNDK